jgi:polyhydroxybutyrate depolymerase
MRQAASPVWTAAVLILCGALIAGCSAGGAASPASGTPEARSPATTPIAALPTRTPMPTTTPPAAPSGGRPYDVFVPTSYRESAPMPLVILLHGYSVSGAEMESMWQLQPMAEERGFLYVHPDGTKDANGERFWNATDGCCNSGMLPVDDSAYLETVIEEVEAKYSVDPQRIYVLGASNGGFMSYRMACDHADKIAAIVSVGGAMYLDATECEPSRPVNVLEVHGTADEVIPYGGGYLSGPNSFPSTATSVADWATYNRCGPSREPTGDRLDLATLPGDETVVSRFAGCPDGGAVELWTVTDGTHVFPFTDAFVPSIVEFLFAHPKPSDR